VAAKRYRSIHRASLSDLRGYQAEPGSALPHLHQ
jgi:hypothetical protein